MPVRTQCPRCKQPLSVPNKLAGSYASCPRCQGRFWVSRDAPLDPPAGDSGGSPPANTLTLTQMPVATPPLATSPARPAASPASPVSGPAGPPPVSAAAANAAALPQVPPRPYFPSVTPQAPLAPAAPLPVPLPSVDGAPSAPPVAPPQARKVARLVSADAAQSTLQLAADGQLPQLQLQEGDQKDKGQGKSRTIPPLVLVGAWILSVVLTVVIMMVLNDDSGSNDTTQAKRDAMARIEEQFFGKPAQGELLPHQRLLREAYKARARKDFKAERQYYKQVLNLLHTETGPPPPHGLPKGITGAAERPGAGTVDPHRAGGLTEYDRVRGANPQEKWWVTHGANPLKTPIAVLDRFATHHRVGTSVLHPPYPNNPG